MMVFLIALFSQIEIKATVDKQEITVGDPIKYQVEIEKKEEMKIEPLEIKQIGSFEIIEKRKERKGNSVKFIYRITTFKTGEDTIPSLSFKCIDKQGNEMKAETEPVVIKVKSVLPADIKDIKDIKSPVSIPGNWLIIVVGIFIFCILAGLVWWLIYRRKHIRIQRAVSLLPPDVVAYKRLETLKLEDGKLKEYYIELSDIIRRYVEAIYKISAPTETTFELYRGLKSARVEYNKVELIKDFLSGCDLVKFAKYIPPMEFIEKDKKYAKDIIDKTKIVGNNGEKINT